MVKDIDLVKIKIMTKWLYDIVEEITNNKVLSDEDIIELLMSAKGIMTDIDKEIVLIVKENSQNKKWWIMVKKIDLIKFEVLLELQLGLINEINENEDLKEDEILEALEIIKNISEEISKDISVLLSKNSENKKWKKYNKKKEL